MSDGSFFIGNSDYWIEDNRLYIPAVDTYVDLIAYDADGGLLSGIWSFEWNADLNLNELTLPVPEPAALAAIIGAIALAVCAGIIREQADQHRLRSLRYPLHGTAGQTGLHLLKAADSKRERLRTCQ